MLTGFFSKFLEMSFIICSGIWAYNKIHAIVFQFLNILFTGTTIKDTWTKSRGRVEVGEGGGFGWGGVEGWGEKAYNCN